MTPTVRCATLKFLRDERVVYWPPLNQQIIRGQNFTAPLPPGFTIVPPNPMMQAARWMQQMRGLPQPLCSYILLPPGSFFGQFTPAVMIVDELRTQDTFFLRQALYSMESPDVAWGVAQSLQVQYIYNVSAPRQMSLGSGNAHMRECDAVGMPPFNVFIHFIFFIIEGVASTVRVVIGVQLIRWAEFVGPCLQLVAGINVAGGPPVPANVIAVADPHNQDQVQFNVVDPQTKQQTPVVSFPTGAMYNVTINVNDNSTRVAGNIVGAGIAVGAHSLQSAAAEIPPERNRMANDTAGEPKFSSNSGTYVGGSVSGTGNAIGAGASSHVSMGRGDDEKVSALLQQLIEAIQAAPLPEATKMTLTQEVIPPIKEDAKKSDFKSAITNGLKTVGLVLSGSGALKENLLNIGAVAKLLAEYGGVALHAVSPFLAAL